MPRKTKILPVIALAPYFLCQFIFSDMGTFLSPDKFSPKVYSSRTIGQTFFSRFPNLTKIGVFINKEDLGGMGEVTFHLRSSPDSGSDIVNIKIGKKDINDNWRLFRFPPTLDKKACLYFFQFAPIQDSKNRSFYFFLEYSGKNEDDGIRLGITERIFNQGYSGGSSYFDSRPQAWYLVFQTYYACNITGKEAFEGILKRIAADRQFAVFYLLLCFVILSAFIYVNILLNRLRERK